MKPTFLDCVLRKSEGIMLYRRPTAGNPRNVAEHTNRQAMQAEAGQQETFDSSYLQ